MPPKPLRLPIGEYRIGRLDTYMTHAQMTELFSGFISIQEKMDGKPIEILVKDRGYVLCCEDLL
jgi:hypothetical protein